MELTATKYKQTEIGLIPVEWKVKSLGDVGEVKMCKRIFNHQTQDKGDIPFYKIGTFGKEPDAFISKEIYQEFRRKYSFPSKGSVLISAAGTIGRLVVYNGEDAYFQDSNIIWIENNNQVITNEYLKHCFPVVKFQTEGGTIQRLYNNILKSGLFPCPQSESEQKAIAQVLSDTDALIQALEKKIAKKKLIKKGVMQKLLTPKEHWKEKQIQDISSVGRGRVISHKEIEKSTNNLYPVYSSQTRNNGIMGYLDQYDFEGEYITWTTDGENAGTVFYREGKFNCTNVCGTIKLNSGFPRFVAYILNTIAPKHVSRNLANPKLMNDPMKKIVIQLPDYDEQVEIANIISDIENEIDVLEQKLSKYQLAKQGMMQQLLTGKIRLV